MKQPVNAVIMKAGLFLSSRSKDIVVLVSILNTTQFQILNLSFAPEVLEDFIYTYLPNLCIFNRFLKQLPSNKGKMCQVMEKERNPQYV